MEHREWHFGAEGNQRGLNLFNQKGWNRGRNTFVPYSIVRGGSFFILERSYLKWKLQWKKL